MLVKSRRESHDVSGITADELAVALERAKIWKKEYEDATKREEQSKAREQESMNREVHYRDSLNESVQREEREKILRRQAEEHAQRVQEENKACNQQIDDLFNQASDARKAAKEAKEEKEKLERELERARSSAAIASILHGTSADATQRQLALEAREEELRQKEAEIARRQEELDRREKAIQVEEQRVQADREQLARDIRPQTETLGEMSDDILSNILPPLSFYDTDDPDLTVITEFDLSFLNDI
jgi:hypothetical protein